MTAHVTNPASVPPRVAAPGTTPVGGPGAAHAFATTHWSLVSAAGDADDARSREALERLCRTYWHPLYHYVRRRGYGPEDAQDLTQSFFARLLERQTFARADPRRGRFRTFLLTALKHFLADEWDKACARKRGGPTWPLDFETEETRLAEVPSDTAAPDQAFERRWALALLEQVYRRLEAEFTAEGKAGHFAVLRVTLTAPRGTTPYAALGEALGLPEGAVKVAVHRLRQRYRARLRDTLAQTVSEPGEVEEELRHLLQVLAG